MLYCTYTMQLSLAAQEARRLSFVHNYPVADKPLVAISDSLRERYPNITLDIEAFCGRIVAQSTVAPEHIQALGIELRLADSDAVQSRLTDYPQITSAELGNTIRYPWIDIALPMANTRPPVQLQRRVNYDLNKAIRVIARHNNMTPAYANPNMRDATRLAGIATALGSTLYMGYSAKQGNTFSPVEGLGLCLADAAGIMTAAAPRGILNALSLSNLDAIRYARRNRDFQPLQLNLPSSS